MRRERTIFHVGMTHAPVNICRGGRLCPPETLDNGAGMGIIKTRGRCDKRSAPEVNDFSQNRNRHLSEWRFLLFSFIILIETEYRPI